MNKILSIIFLSMAFSFTNAQSLKFKPTIGLNANSQKTSITFANKTKPGVDIGLLTEIKLKQNISLETGLLFSSFSGSLERAIVFDGQPLPTSASPAQVHENNKFAYLRLPILVNIKQAKKDPFSFGMGLVVKTNLSANRETYLLTSPSTVYSDKYKLKTQSGGVIGLGFQSAVRKEFSILNKKFEAGLYYDTDLSKWQYPYNHAGATNTQYTTKSNNFSVLFSMIL